MSFIETMSPASLTSFVSHELNRLGGQYQVISAYDVCEDRLKVSVMLCVDQKIHTFILTWTGDKTKLRRALAWHCSRALQIFWAGEVVTDEEVAQ